MSSEGDRDRNLDAELIADSSFFDERWYLKRNPDVAASGASPVMHYLVYGAMEGRDPSPAFSTSAYLEQRPDVSAAGLNPLVHYLRYGISEMLSLPPAPYDVSKRMTLSDMVRHGILRARTGSTLRFGRARRRIFFVTHEASRTGAPLILKTLVSHFALSGNYDLFTFVAGPPAELMEEFQHYSHVVDCSKHNFFDSAYTFGDFVTGLGKNVILAVCNTANVNSFAKAFRNLNIPVMTLVHEMAYPYDREHFASIYQCSDKVIFPAEFVRAIADAKAPIPPGKAAVVPQGLLDANIAVGLPSEARRSVRRELGIPDDSFIVLGCGAVDARKGVDLFVSLAEKVSNHVNNVHFVWLGSVTRVADFVYWVKKDVRAAGLAGKVHLIGARDDPGRYFLSADIFALTSREDPFPCVVHEAMACALPVIAFEGSGGAIEALQGESGIIVPYRDLERMSNAVLELHGDASKRHQIGQTARQRVETVYAFRDYYAELVRIANDELKVSIDPRNFVRRDLNRPLVFFFTRDWWISGVNSFTETLMRGLLANGVNAQLIFPTINQNDLSYIPTVPHRFLRLDDLTLEEQWKELIDFAERNAPCVLVPNYDYLTSAISPALSSQVGVVGIVHSDDVEHYDHAYRLGRYWNRIVCLTSYMAKKVGEINPSLTARTVVIPHGIPVDDNLPDHALRDPADPIRIVYSGRVMQHQKRVHDFVVLTQELDRRKTPYKLTVIGEGDDYHPLKNIWKDEIADGRVVMTGRLSREQTLREIERNEVFLLVSDFEGMPLALLEAMSYGLVPVVTDTPCGIPELILHDVTGLLAPVGDMAEFANHIDALQKDPLRLGRLSAGARQHILMNGFRDIDMTRQYTALVRDIWSELLTSSYRRPEALLWRAPVPNISIPGFLWNVR